MKWQVQEAKQRFSELLRTVAEEGPQAVTKHGEEVAMVVDITWYREHTGQQSGLGDWLLHGPKSEDFVEIMESTPRSFADERHRAMDEWVDELVVDKGLTP